jgi:hypothetical protein
MREKRIATAVAAAACLALTAGCAGVAPQTTPVAVAPTSTAPAAPTDASATSVPATPSSVPSLPVTATQPPSTKSDLPDGTYRTTITPQLLADKHVYDQGQLGTWTLVVKDGGYQLWCEAENSQTECGDDEKAGNVQVEQGFLRGPGPTVWVVHDMAWTRRACGATNGHPNCPSGGYRMTWRREGSRLVFSDAFGIGDEGNGAYATELNNWTIQPWTRVE